MPISVTMSRRLRSICRPRTRSFAAALFVPLMALPLHAQGTVPLEPGARVRLRAATGTPWQIGLLLHQSADSLAARLEGRAEPATFAWSNLSAVQVSRGLHSSAPTGALVGAAVGASASVVILLALNANEPIDMGAGALYGALLSLGTAGLGALIAAPMRRETWQQVASPPGAASRVETGRTGPATAAHVLPQSRRVTPAPKPTSLEPGTRVRIQTAPGGSWRTGLAMAQVGDSLRVQLEGEAQPRAFARHDLADIQVSRGAHAKTGAGAVVGAAVGLSVAGALVASGINDVEPLPGTVTMWCGLAIGGGTVLGALVGTAARPEAWQPTRISVLPERGGRLVARVTLRPRANRSPER